MNIKPIIYLFLAIFLIISPKNIQAESKLEFNNKNDKVNIKFVKEISTSLEGSLGTIYIAKVGDYLILHDSHVSERKLVCIEYSTGKEIWKIEGGVERFYIYNDKILVDLLNEIALFNVKNAKQIWKIKDSSISYEYENASDVYNNLLVVYNGKEGVLDLETQKVKHFDKGVLLAYYFKLGNNKVVKSMIGIENNYNSKDKILKTIIIEDKNGVKKKYIWTLNKRKFNLITFDDTSTSLSNPKEINRITWKMDDKKQLPKDYFNGNPEPEKLETKVYFINNRLFLFENYVNYRWSRNRGNNRVTNIDWEKGKLNYQKWGQGPLDKKFKTFHFFDNIILMSDTIMHFQDGFGSFSRFNEKKGEVLDLLTEKTTLLKDFDDENLLAFNYIRKHIKKSEYTNTIEMKLWNKVKNKFSKTFRFEYKEKYPYQPAVFSKDALVMFYFYLKRENKSILHLYKVKKR